MSQKRKVLIIGAAGRMGAALARHCALNQEVIRFTRSNLDVTDIGKIKPTLEKVDFDCLIYTAGITNVDYCEDHAKEAALTNLDTPRALAEFCQERKLRFIHVSTDYVFSGDGTGKLRETDAAEPVNVYGRTKLDGEKAVLAVSSEFLVLRVSWLFGPDKPSFPDMVIARALENDRVEVIADKWSCPTYSEDLARWIEPMIDDLRYKGILHLSNSGSCSWEEYGQTTLDHASKMGLPLKAFKVVPVPLAGFSSFKARRPIHTEFDTTRFQEMSGIKPRPWQDALEEYLMQKYSDHIVPLQASRGPRWEA
jgi:dTDP-4-dehydrorhamnose reductase